MTWTEASGTYWMAVLIMGVLGYIKQKELLWRNADQRRRVPQSLGQDRRKPRALGGQQLLQR